MESGKKATAPVQYVEIRERNSWEHETWHFYLTYSASDKNLRYLLRSIDRYRPNGITAKIISEEEFKRVDFNSDRCSYMADNTLIDKKIPKFNFRSQEEIESALYKGGLNRYWFRTGKTMECFCGVEEGKTLKELLLCFGFDLSKGFLTEKEVLRLKREIASICKKWKAKASKWRNRKSDKTGGTYEEIKTQILFESDALKLKSVIETAAKEKSKLYFE